MTMADEVTQVEAHLAKARHWAQQGRFDEAIDWLRECNRSSKNVQYEQLLAQYQYEIFVAKPPQAAPMATWPAEVSDPFRGCSGIPEIDAGELNAHTLSAGIRYHGALIVRGLLHESKALEMAQGVQRTLDACGQWHQKELAEFDSPWYWRLPLPTECELAPARLWVEGAGGVWTADSPRMLFELIETFERQQVIKAIEDYIVERPLLSVGKST